MIHCLMEESWYDAAFARQWTNGPFLLNRETGKVVTEADLTPDGAPTAISSGTNCRDQPAITIPLTASMSVTACSRLCLVRARSKEKTAGNLMPACL